MDGSREAEESILVDVARSIREKVVGARSGPAAQGRGPDGDVQFAVDEIAEAALREECARHRLRARILSESGPARGEGVERPLWWLVADPIDGSRAAKSGMPMWCVSLALAPYGDHPKVADVQVAIIGDGGTGTTFAATRDGPVRAISPAGETTPLKEAGVVPRGCLPAASSGRSRTPHPSAHPGRRSGEVETSHRLSIIA